MAQNKEWVQPNDWGDLITDFRARDVSQISPSQMVNSADSFFPRDPTSNYF
jgi:hypothetical protein